MGEAVASREGGMEVEKTLTLPRRFLRVLLVESDDSTRQIIAALLRKCSYRGTLAFKTLFTFLFLIAHLSGLAPGAAYLYLGPIPHPLVGPISAG